MDHVTKIYEIADKNGWPENRLLEEIMILLSADSQMAKRVLNYIETLKDEES